MSWNKKHLLDIESLTADEIVTVLDTARAFKAVGERAIKKVPALRGKTVVNLFIEPSTRTRISFELAAQRLTADIVNFSADASSFKKGETLKDTAKNLEALNADFIIIRHSASGAPHFLSRVVKAGIINAGDGAHEHPTQALLDAFTIREHKEKFAGLNVTILGDILYSRVARSNIWALTKLGAKVTLCGPSTLVPKTFEQMGCRVTHDVDEAIHEADIIHLLRIQHERQRKTMFPGIGEYTTLFGLNKARLMKT
ncbi:MAG TPA: aspartate carbamoyltransferase catalytic subunit, partial [Verrucomicrobiae bacterium]|nr:aspartate carbamoyltransferase catalytic subunit [Verrucomicrobiae bacterium]